MTMCWIVQKTEVYLFFSIKRNKNRCVHPIFKEKTRCPLIHSLNVQTIWQKANWRKKNEYDSQPFVAFSVLFNHTQNVKKKHNFLIQISFFFSHSLLILDIDISFLFKSVFFLVHTLIILINVSNINTFTWTPNLYI